MKTYTIALLFLSLCFNGYSQNAKTLVGLKFSPGFAESTKVNDYKTFGTVYERKKGQY